MKTIDQRINDARNAVKKADEASKPAAQAQLQLLEDLKADGVFTQADFNNHDKRVKEQYEENIQNTLGMPLDEFEQVVASVSETLGDDGEGEGDGGDGKEGGTNVLARRQRELEERDKRLKAAEDSTTGLSRSLYSERVENRLKETLREKGLKDGRFELARILANENELVEKLMNGETLPEDAYTARANRLLEQSPEWFGQEGGGGGEINGVRLKEGALETPGIPATPDSRHSSDLTEEDRAARATSVF